MPKDTIEFMIENAQLVFLNFSGREDRFNKEGERSFCCILDPGTAQKMARDGWNIKTLKARDEESEDTPYIQVKVSYKVRPPTVIVITDSGRTRLTSESIGMLDWAEIRTVDFIANAYNWEVNGKTGITAYLKSLYVTINEDPLERKYGIVGGD